MSQLSATPDQPEMIDAPPPRQWTLARRPAAGAAVAFIAGVAAYDVFPHRPSIAVAIAITLLVMAICLRARPLAATICLALSIFAVAVARAQAAQFRFPGNDIALFAGDQPRLARLELRITDPPRIITQPAGNGARRALPPKQVTQAEVLRVMTWHGWSAASGRMLVQVVEPNPRLAAGQTVRVLGMLQRPGPAMNPGQFDWAKYYREQRICTSLQIPGAGNIEIIALPPRFMPLTWLRQRTRELLAMGFTTRHALDHALLRALLLGDNDPVLRDVQDDFRRTGTSHHLSISGLHIAVLGGFIYLLCRLLRLTPRVSTWAMMIFVVLYGVIALPSAPVVRSVLLCGAFGLGRVMRRSVDPIQLLALSVLGMLAYHPQDLFNAGFQLSFGTVLGLMLFTRPAERLIRGGAEVDPLPPATMARVTLRQRVAQTGDRTLVTILAAGLVAWMVSLPLIARHFEQLNPWAVLASIILAPLVLLALIGGLLKVLLTLLWPGGAAAWALMAGWPMAAMRHLVDFLARFPSSDVPMPRPPTWLIVAFYASLCLFMLKRWKLPGMRFLARCAPIAACSAIFLLPLRDDLAQRLPERGADLRVTLLAVGAGQAAVIEPPSGRTILVDAGSSSLTDLLFSCLGPYLRHQGHAEVDSVIITHANYDHFSAVAELAAGYDVREVLTGAQFRAHARGNPPAEVMLSALDRLDRPPRVLEPGQRIPLGRDCGIEILWPPATIPAGSIDDNDASVVFRLWRGDRAILFTGDIEDRAMRQLRQTPEKLRADVLVAPHHGSSEAETAEFIRAVAPRWVLSSNDRTLTGKQLRLDRLMRQMNIDLLRTNRCGAITVTLPAAGVMRVETFLPPAPGNTY